MRTTIIMAGIATVAALISANAAYAAQDMATRMAAVEQCVAQAQQQVADPTGARSSSVQTARTQVYSACMRKKGLWP